MILLIQESSESDSEVVKVKKKKKNPPMIHKSLASKSNLLEESSEAIVK